MRNAHGTETENGTNTTSGEIKVTPGFRCKDGDISLTAVAPVPGKPGFWLVQESVMSLGFRIGRQKAKPLVEMSEEKLIQMKLAHHAHMAAKTFMTAGYSPNEKIRKKSRLDTKLFTRKTPLGRQSPKVNRLRLIHESLKRVNDRFDDAQPA